MKKLLNLKKAILEIAQVLAQNNELCRLVYNDISDPLSTDVPESVDLNYLIQNHYFSIEPPVENRINDFDRNTFITILLDSASPTEDKNTRGYFYIYVTTNSEHLLIKDNKNRLLEMADCVIDSLEERKITSSGALAFTSMQFVMLSDFHPSYRLSFRIADQAIRKAEI